MCFCIIIQIKRSRETFLKLSFFFVEEKTLVTWKRRNNHVNNYFRTIFFFLLGSKSLEHNRMLENGHVFPHQVTIDFTTINADTFKMLSISTEPKNTKKNPFQSFEVLKILPYFNTTKWSYVIKKRQITNYHFQHMECSRQLEIISNNPVLIWQKGSRS